ncbi:MAG: hypothetical protein NUV97_02065 [archaeon]|nr:hypothetical protein [archaeon]MCR4323736.1 hypothetical protein [Nanoarchaeota archaeon]
MGFNEFDRIVFNSLSVGSSVAGGFFEGIGERGMAIGLSGVIGLPGGRYLYSKSQATRDVLPYSGQETSLEMGRNTLLFLGGYFGGLAFRELIGSPGGQERNYVNNGLYILVASAMGVGAKIFSNFAQESKEKKRDSC